MPSETTIIPTEVLVDNVTIEKNGSNQLQIKDGGVGTAIIEDGAITNGKLGAGAVTIDKILAGYIKKLVYSDEVDVSLGNVSSGTYKTIAFPSADWEGKQLKILFQAYQISSGGGSRILRFRINGTNILTFGGGNNVGTDYTFEVILTKTREDGTGNQNIRVDYRNNGSSTAFAVTNLSFDTDSEMTLVFDMTSDYTGGTHSTTFRWVEIQSL